MTWRALYVWSYHEGERPLRGQEAEEGLHHELSEPLGVRQLVQTGAQGHARRPDCLLVECQAREDEAASVHGYTGRLSANSHVTLV
jgi:hypothetical protein